MREQTVERDAAEGARKKALNEEYRQSDCGGVHKEAGNVK
jgi:hypothetical protein